MNKAKTIFQQMLITGFNNSAMSCDDISILIFFFFTQLVITRISYIFSGILYK